VAEAANFVVKRGSTTRVTALWKLIRNLDILTIRHTTNAEQARAEAVMAKYVDLPADLADALLVAAAEVLGDLKILTIDRDFRVYSTSDGRVLDVRPTSA
jgi:predicted nucleic acid-binding protein